jgi:hypothetical protein
LIIKASVIRCFFNCHFTDTNRLKGKGNYIADFKIIETQEQFDAAIGPRLERERNTYAKQLEADYKAKGWKSPEEIEALTKDLNDQIGKLQTAAADKEKIIADKDAEIAKGEKYRSDLAKTRIVIGMGLPMEEAERLIGTNETEWKEDAKKVVERYQGWAKAQNKPTPIGSPEGTGSGTTRDQFASWAASAFNN